MGEFTAGGDLERLGLARAKEILPDVLSAAEQHADGLPRVLDRLLEEEIAAREDAASAGRCGSPE